MRGEFHRLQPTPIDEVSRLPHLFVPDEGVLPYLGGRRNRRPNSTEPICDDNHAWHERQKVNDHLGGAGNMLRISRTQFVFRADHNNYHSYYGGPELPESKAAMFGAVLLQLANYIPPVALNMRAASPKSHLLKPEEIARLQQSGEVRPESGSRLRRLVSEYLLRQPMDFHFRNRELLLGEEVPNPGNAVLGAAIGTMIDQIHHVVPEETRQVYQHGYANNLIHPDAPPTAEDFLYDYMVGDTPYTILPYARALQSELQAQQ